MNTEPKASDALREIQTLLNNDVMGTAGAKIYATIPLAEKMEAEIERLQVQIATQAKGAEEASALMRKMEAERDRLREALANIENLLERFGAQAISIRDGFLTPAAQPFCAIRKASAAYNFAHAALHPTEPAATYGTDPTWPRKPGEPENSWE